MHLGKIPLIVFWDRRTKDYWDFLSDVGVGTDNFGRRNFQRINILTLRIVDGLIDRPMH